MQRRFCICGSLFLFCVGLVSCTFTITNNCPNTIWPATLAGAGTQQLATTGFRLDSGESASIASRPGWSGRIWARTGCDFDDKGIGICQTGDCGGRLQCDGLGAAPPISLFEVTLGQGDQGLDFYDVSVVDGYNLAIVAAPIGGHGECNATGCLSDLNQGCPKELQALGGDGVVVGCKSACKAFASDEYCCNGQFANPTKCQPSYYSTIFKTACPRVYSYAFDDRTSTFTCNANDYAIIFCPRENGTSNDTTRPAIQDYNRGSQALVSSTSSILHVPATILNMLILCIFAVFTHDVVMG